MKITAKIICALAAMATALSLPITAAANIWEVPTMDRQSDSDIPYVQQKLSFTAQNGETIGYYVCTPKDFDDSTVYPLVVYMHGIGGDTDISGYEYLRREMFSRGFNAVLIAPIADWDGGQDWIDRQKVLIGEGPRQDYHQDELTPTKALVAAKELITQSKTTYHTAQNRTYCVGVSMGGYATYELITRYPGLIDAAVPICGAGDISKAYLLSDLPVWAFHGTADAAVDYNCDKAMGDAIAATGNPNFRFTTYEGVDHGIWFKAMSEAYMLKWLFSQNNGIYETLTEYTAPGENKFFDVKIKLKVTDADPLSCVTLTSDGKSVALQAHARQGDTVWLSCKNFLSDSHTLQLTVSGAELLQAYATFSEKRVYTDWTEPNTYTEDPWDGTRVDSSWNGIDDFDDNTLMVKKSNVKVVNDPYICQTVLCKSSNAESGYFMYAADNRYITGFKMNLSAIPGFLPADVNGFITLYAIAEENGAETPVNLTRDEGVLIYENDNAAYNYYGYNVESDALPAGTRCVKIKIAEKYVNYTICIDKIALTLEPINPDEDYDYESDDESSETETEISDETSAPDSASSPVEDSTDNQEPQAGKKGVSPWIYILLSAVIVAAVAVIIITKLKK